MIVTQQKRYWLWCAVDSEGEVPDFIVQSKSDAGAAGKPMREPLK